MDFNKETYMKMGRHDASIFTKETYVKIGMNHSCIFPKETFVKMRRREMERWGIGRWESNFLPTNWKWTALYAPAQNWVKWTGVSTSDFGRLPVVRQDFCNICVYEG